MAGSKRKVLIAGVSGNLGFELAVASLKASHETIGLVRQSAFADQKKLQKIRMLEEQGIHIVQGSMQDEDMLMAALKQVDVVICAVSSKDILEQKCLIPAIKRAGCIKVLFSLSKMLPKFSILSFVHFLSILQRFIPSEFGSDPDKIWLIE